MDDFLFNPIVNVNGVVTLYDNDEFPSTMLWKVKEVTFIKSIEEHHNGSIYYTLCNDEGRNILVLGERISQVISYGEGDSEQIQLSKSTKSVRVLTPEERDMTVEQRIDLALDKMNYADTIGKILHTEEEVEKFKKKVLEDLKRFTEDL